MTTQRNRNRNQFFLNGQIIGVEGDKVLLENYINNKPAVYPITIPTAGQVTTGEWVDLTGKLVSEKIAPHTYQYSMVADSICISSMLEAKYIRPTNKWQVTAFLTQDPNPLENKHPYLTILYLGTGDTAEGDSFSGNRQEFDVSLLRKKSELATSLKAGDVIEVEASITFSEEYGIQLIGKELSKFEKRHEEQRFMQNYNTTGLAN